MKKVVVLWLFCFVLAFAQGVFAHCDPGHIESLTLAVNRRACRCGFTSAGDCKPCKGSEGDELREKGCMYGYSETGDCLKKDRTIMKQCKCGYDAGGCLPCDEGIIGRSRKNSEE